MAKRTVKPKDKNAAAARQALLEDAVEGTTAHNGAIYECQFHPYQAWAFDVAFPEWHIAIEMEGGSPFNGTSAHARGRFLTDMGKYNQALLLQWQVIRMGWINFDGQYLADMVNYLVEARRRAGWRQGVFAHLYPETYVVMNDGTGHMLGQSFHHWNKYTWFAWNRRTNTEMSRVKEKSDGDLNPSPEWDVGFWRPGGKVKTAWYAHPYIPPANEVKHVWVNRTATHLPLLAAHVNLNRLRKPLPHKERVTP